MSVIMLSALLLLFACHRVFIRSAATFPTSWFCR